MTKKKNEKKPKEDDFSLRDQLIAAILPDYQETVGYSDFKENFDQRIRKNKKLISLLRANRNDPLINKRMILGYLPDKAKPIVRLLIQEILLAGN